MALVFTFLFFLEGLYRTKLLPIFALIGVVMAVLVVPLAPYMPHTFQRSLAFLPLDISPEVRQDAQNSTNWRFDMWKALLPEIPQYLLLGKGYALSANDFQLLAGEDAAVHTFKGFEEDQLYALNGNYHNGILSVVIPLGIWGLITYLWFLGAGLYVLHCNWKYGNPQLHTINLLMFVQFLIEAISFVSCVGGSPIEHGLFYLGGCLGLSVALNNGVCQPVPEPVQETNRFRALGGVRAHLQPSFRRNNSQA